LAYKKHTSWTPLVSPLTLPQTCLSATICAVELRLPNTTKVAIISCYLPQTLEAHAITCNALSQLSHTVPHSLIILGGDLQEGWEHSLPKDMHIVALTYKRWVGPMLPTFTPRQQRTNRFKRYVLTTSLYGTPTTFRSRRRTQLRSKPPF
jgi:hypothetical protein